MAAEARIAAGRGDGSDEAAERIDALLRRAFADARKAGLPESPGLASAAACEPFLQDRIVALQTEKDALLALLSEMADALRGQAGAGELVARARALTGEAAEAA